MAQDFPRPLQAHCAFSGCKPTFLPFWLVLDRFRSKSATALCLFCPTRQAGAPGGCYRAGMEGIRMRVCLGVFLNQAGRLRGMCGFRRAEEE